jgi:hypothetical protein
MDPTRAEASAIVDVFILKLLYWFDARRLVRARLARLDSFDR